MKRQKREKPEQVARRYLYRDPSWLEVRYINEEKGRGVFSLRTFSQGDFIVTYRGVLVLKRNIKEKEELYEQFNLGSFVFDFNFNGQEWCIDATEENGTYGRLVNDSKYFFNAVAKQTVIDELPFICLFANKTINIGEEITYFYGEHNLPWHKQEYMLYLNLCRRRNKRNKSKDGLATIKHERVCCKLEDDDYDDDDLIFIKKSFSITEQHGGDAKIANDGNNDNKIRSTYFNNAMLTSRKVNNNIKTCSLDFNVKFDMAEEIGIIIEKEIQSESVQSTSIYCAENNEKRCTENTQNQNFDVIETPVNQINRTASKSRMTEDEDSDFVLTRKRRKKPLYLLALESDDTTSSENEAEGRDEKVIKTQKKKPKRSPSSENLQKQRTEDICQSTPSTSRLTEEDDDSDVVINRKRRKRPLSILSDDSNDNISSRSEAETSGEVMGKKKMKKKKRSRCSEASTDTPKRVEDRYTDTPKCVEDRSEEKSNLKKKKKKKKRKYVKKGNLDNCLEIRLNSRFLVLAA